MRHIQTHGSTQRALSLRLSCGVVNCQKGQLTARKENFHSSRFTARSLCRNRGPCWSARPPSLRCALRFGLLFSRFSVPPSLRGLSSRHPIPCRRLLSRSRGLAACRARYLLGLPPFGAFRLLPGCYQSGVSPSPFVVKP